MQDNSERCFYHRPPRHGGLLRTAQESPGTAARPPTPNPGGRSEGTRAWARRWAQGLAGQPILDTSSAKWGSAWLLAQHLGASEVDA